MNPTQTDIAFKMEDSLEESTLSNDCKKCQTVN